MSWNQIKALKFNFSDYENCIFNVVNFDTETTRSTTDLLDRLLGSKEMAELWTDALSEYVHEKSE